MKIRVCFYLFIAALVSVSSRVEAAEISTSQKTQSIQILSAWARPTTGPSGAIYLELHNSTEKDRTLIEAKVCGTICDHAELHTHIHEGDIKRMRPIKDIVIKSGETKSFQPGGLHIMLMGLKAPLREGQKVPITLVFDNEEVVQQEVMVQQLASLIRKGDNEPLKSCCDS